MQDHPKLGPRGAVCEVRPGHMRHMLYPNGQAVYATDANLIRHAWPMFQAQGPELAQAENQNKD